MRLVWPAPNRTFGFLDALGLTGAMGLLAARTLPLATLPFWGCSLREATGWPCPACGLTRVAERVASFQIGAAFEASPLGAVAALLFALAAGWSILHLV